MKVPRKTHAQKDAAAAEEFQRTLCERLASLNVAGGRRVRLWVADEHRYGLIPVVRKCWTLRGVRPMVPYRTKYEWGYLYSALEVDGENAAEFLCLPEVSLEMSGLFLNHLAASDPEAEHIVIWDQAGFHPKPELHAVPERVHLVALPAYSPELNPTEAIGDIIKDRIGNALWQAMSDLEEAISEELRPLCENAEAVRRLVSHPWLVEQANATATENDAITCSKWYYWHFHWVRHEVARTVVCYGYIVNKPAVPSAESIGTGVTGNGAGRKLPGQCTFTSWWGMTARLFRDCQRQGGRRARLDDTPN